VEWAVCTKHLTKIYSPRLIAVNDLNLEILKNFVSGLPGANGAGKTTTFRLLPDLPRSSAKKFSLEEKTESVYYTSGNVAPRCPVIVNKMHARANAPHGGSVSVRERSARKWIRNPFSIGRMGL